MGYECLLALDKKYGNELKNATLILGNGSSISYSSKFAYSSLYDEAAFTDEEKQIADYDENGVVDLYDAIGIAKKLLEK